MQDLLRILTLADFNTRVVLLGTALLGLACGVVGALTVLRGRALVSDALAHAALPGVCVAFLLLGTRELPALLAGALLFGAASLLALALMRRHHLVREDAAIALTLSAFFGLGIVLLSVAQRSPDGAHAGLEGFIFGKAAGMLTRDVLILAVVAILVLATVFAMRRALLVVCFDRAFGQAAGLPMARADVALMGLTCVATVAALPAVGLVLVVAMLTIPPAAARLWTDRLPVMVAISGGLGAASGVVGTIISATVERLSTGPVVVLVAAAGFACSLAFAPHRGLLPAWVRRLRTQRRTSEQNLLRAIYELREASPGPVPIATLALKRAWRAGQLETLLARAQARGELTRDPAGHAVELTPRGVTLAERIVRAHRLWELYLIEHASLPPDHVDRDADQIEHLLSPQLLAQLEQRLPQTRRAARVDSPHPIPTTENIDPNR